VTSIGENKEKVNKKEKQINATHIDGKQYRSKTTKSQKKKLNRCENH